MKLGIIAIFVLATVAAGCSEDKDPIEALADYYSRTQQIGCQLALECCTESELPQLYDVTVEQIHTCAEIPQDVSEAMEVLYGDALDSGRLKFDAGRADACLEVWESLTCAQWAQPGSVVGNLCDDPFIPQQGPGEPCNQSYECTTGSCEGGSMMTEGTCGTPPGAGEECSVTCVEGYYCLFSTCEPMLDDGESCSSHRECTSGFCFTPDGGTEDACGVMCDGV